MKRLPISPMRSNWSRNKSLIILPAVRFTRRRATRERRKTTSPRPRQIRLKAVLEERGLAKTPASKAAIDSVGKRIHEEVKRLEYSDAVAQELLAMVRDWNLAALEQKLAAAKDEQRRGRLSKDKLAQAERESAETLCQEIAAVVRHKEVRELDEVIRGKSACCMGLALLFNVLGRSIGLDVQGLDVPITVVGRLIDDRGAYGVPDPSGGWTSGDHRRYRKSGRRGFGLQAFLVCRDLPRERQLLGTQGRSQSVGPAPTRAAAG